MGCQSEVSLGGNLTFSICTHDADTGALTDTSAAPAYRVYENETATPILTGTMAVLDTANTTGFYTELVACTAANGFEVGKTYTIYIEATVDGITGGIAFGFVVDDIASSVWDVTTSIHQVPLTFGLALGATTPNAIANVQTTVETVAADVATSQVVLEKVDGTLELNPGREEYQFSQYALELSPAANAPSAAVIAAEVWATDNGQPGGVSMGVILGTTVPQDTAEIKATLVTVADTVAKVDGTLELNPGSDQYQFSEHALELSPTGDVPSASTIAAEVWATDTVNFKSAGSMGRALGTTAPADSAAAQAVLDKIDTTVEKPVGHTTYRFTDVALELTPGSALTTEDITDAVWSAELGYYDVDGTAGKALSTASTGGVDYTSLVAAIMNYTVAGTFTVGEVMRIVAATTSGKPVGLGTHTIAFRDLDDTKNVVTCTLDDAGNVLTLTLNEGP